MRPLHADLWARLDNVSAFTAPRRAGSCPKLEPFLHPTQQQKTNPHSSAQFGHPTPSYSPTLHKLVYLTTPLVHTSVLHTTPHTLISPCSKNSHVLPSPLGRKEAHTGKSCIKLSSFMPATRHTRTQELCTAAVSSKTEAIAPCQGAAHWEHLLPGYYYRIPVHTFRTVLTLIAQSLPQPVQYLHREETPQLVEGHSAALHLRLLRGTIVNRTYGIYKNSIYSTIFTNNTWSY